MPLGDLPHERRVRQHALDGGHHAVDVAALLQEAELLGEGELADDIEGVVLEPGAEVEGAVAEGGETRCEERGAGVDSGLGEEELGHGEGVGDLLLHVAVFGGQARREDVHGGLLAPGDALDGVEGGLGRLAGADVRWRRRDVGPW